MSLAQNSIDNSYETRRKHAGPAFDLLAAAAVFVAALAAYWHTTGYYFSQDDFTFLARAKGLQPYPGFWDPFGTRIISTRLYFLAMHGLFGLEPGPYHWAGLLLHALNALLVYAVARLWTKTSLVALVAGLIFATADLAFTALFWISGIQDLLATTFLLLAALIWVSRTEKGLATAILSAAALGLSMLSKETGLLFPAVIVLMAWAGDGWGRRRMPLVVPHLAVFAMAVALLAVQSSKVPEGGAYGVGLTGDLFHNAATYLKWTADVLHPFKDRVASIDYGAWKTTSIVIVLLLVFLFSSRGRQARMQWAAVGWYALTIAPVLPLLHHTYLYYLYPAAPGAAILAGLAAHRMTNALSRRLGSRGVTVGWILSVGAAAALCTMGSVNVRAREGTVLPPDYKLPHDHVLRSSVLARNAVSGFASTRVPEGAAVLLINPYAPTSVNLTEGAGNEGRLRSYDMVRGALRDGTVLKLLRPDLSLIDFAYRMDSKWEKSHAFLYDAFGALTYLGTGADIWANLSTLHLRDTKRIEEAVRCGKRALELNPDHPRASLNLGIAMAMGGSVEEARNHLTRAAELAPTPTIRDNALLWLNSLEEK